MRARSRQQNSYLLELFLGCSSSPESVLKLMHCGNQCVKAFTADALVDKCHTSYFVHVAYTNAITHSIRK